MTDMVSSGTVPDLADVPETELRELMDRLLQDGNFFTGLNPRAVLRMLSTHSDFEGRVGDIHFEGPWLWQLSSQRTCLAYAVSFCHTHASPEPP